MTVIWITLVIAYMFSLYARYLSTPVPLGLVEVRPNKLMAIVAVFTLALVAGLRNNIGDTYFYMHTYRTQDVGSWDFVLSQKDVGFNIYQMILKQFSDDPQLLVFVSALITNVLIGYVLYKYSRLLELSIFVFVTSGMYIVSMNGIRQYLAAAILFAATKYLLEGDWKKYCLVILLASGFHQTAIILIPIYFMVRRKAWTVTTFVLLFIAIIFTVGYGQFSSAFFSAIDDTHYSEYQNFNEGGANIIRVFVDLMPVVLAYLGRERLRELFPKSDYIVNLSLLSVVFMIIATQNWIFARMSIYFGLYQLLLISWIIKAFREKEQRFVYYSILICYCVYFYYENVVTLGIVYRSHYL
ncbi:capsular biosynthesis protein [Ammoniphilus oxalaticus]|uniref:Capsular biosynthesis protein n=1 Tax=Ammoniphilus oxalaticus TaxID=66863 RepID=A0A419SHA7_9BACL|nr:EpsG family protein [Ammoniphilus oxalaticus]RKD23167.1 capsular biosynthesis protein [Ammoniphilus oxalaticus]